MHIKTYQYAGVIAWASVVLLMGTLLVGANRDMSAAVERSIYTRDIVEGIGQQRLALVEYLLHHHQRAKAQWQASHESLTRFLRSGIVNSADEQEEIDVLRRRHEEIMVVFSKLVDNYESRGETADQIAMSRELEARLVSRMLDISQAKIDNAFRLENINQVHLDDARRRSTALVVIAIGVTGLFLIANAVLTIRNVLHPIAHLQRAMDVIAKGDLSYRTSISSNNEFGALSRAFDRMTERLQASLAELTAKTSQMVEANAELEAFSYSVSHDLRGPLRSMDGFSLALLEDYDDKLDDEGKDFLRRIRAACQRMGQLTDDLLGLSRVTRAELNVTQVDLSALAREIAASLRGEPSVRTVQWQIEDGVTIRADTALIRIAMQNLLENAWKFTGKSPVATIRVGAQACDGKQAVFVADNGVGFDMAYADRLFGAFQRLHHARDFPGTGIGLAIVQRVIRRHKGRIWAEATEGKGATFFFTLGEADYDARGQDHPAG